jgi:hypothetical protein
VVDENGYPHPNAGTSSGKKSKKKKKKKAGQASVQESQQSQPYSATHVPPPPPPPPPHSSNRYDVHDGHDRIWNTSSQEERERIKEFWQSLGEEERKSLVKIEKEAVLRKMKDQQKHSCSCTVCGRKRTAIEEELEVLYDAYYEELEQYALSAIPLDVPFFFQSSRRRRKPLTGEDVVMTDVSDIVEKPAPENQPDDRYHPGGVPPLIQNTPHANPQYGEFGDEYLEDEEEEEDDEEEEEEEDDDEEEDEDDLDEEYSEEEYEEDDLSEDLPLPPQATQEFESFGKSLTVKGGLDRVGHCSLGHQLTSPPGGILTVADDLLKNEGKKFIEMMEQLAERRMAREEDAQYGGHHAYSEYSHDDPGADDEEDYEDEDEDYASDDFEDEDDEMASPAEKQPPNIAVLTIPVRYDGFSTYGRRSPHVPNLCRSNVRTACSYCLSRKGRR